MTVWWNLNVFDSSVKIVIRHSDRVAECFLREVNTVVRCVVSVRTSHVKLSEQELCGKANVSFTLSQRPADTASVSTTPTTVSTVSVRCRASEFTSSFVKGGSLIATGAILEESHKLTLYLSNIHIITMV